MITMHQRHLDLPEHFPGGCPSCKKSVLVWDGRWAWRCQGQKCRHGVTLSALFAEDDLDLLLEQGVPVERLHLSSYAIVLVRQGVLTLPWLTEVVVKRSVVVLTTRDRREELEDLKLLMQRPKERV